MGVLDVAIVGGGVAGCYCAYRLAGRPEYPSIELFEQTDRIGGRLWSVPIKGVQGGPIELGGTFVSSLHTNLFYLIQNQLTGVNLKGVDWQSTEQFLRGVPLTDADYVAEESPLPFQLKLEERGKTPQGILHHALSKILDAKVSTLWPMLCCAKPSDTITVMQTVVHRGRHLWQWGFWNLLAETVSNEAYEILLATYGTASSFRNSNAFDAVWVLMAEGAPQDCYKVDGGFQKVPKALLDQCKKPVPKHLSSELVRIERTGAELELHFEGEGAAVIHAKHVILALPQAALKRITFGAGVVPPLFFEDLDAVEPVPACKLFLVFDSPWWDASNHGPSNLNPNAIRSTLTDLPMRNCYYYGEPLMDQCALMQAAFADDVSASFWSGLVEPPAKKSVIPQKWLAVPSEFYGPEHMVRAVCHQLKHMHEGYDVPMPRTPVFIDWRTTPARGGWHSWKPHLKSWEVRERMRRPDANVPLYVCGEAFSQLPGWVEGALNSAELALAPFGVERPNWVKTKPEFQFEYSAAG